MGATPEGKFKTDFRKELKKLGAVFVLQYKQDSTTISGFPDTIAIFEGFTVFIEFKAHKTAKFQPLQKEQIAKLDRANHFVYVVYPDNASEILNQIKELL